jgi:hypothetical protein
MRYRTVSAYIVAYGQALNTVLDAAVERSFTFSGAHMKTMEQLAAWTMFAVAVVFVYAALVML